MYQVNSNYTGYLVLSAIVTSEINLFVETSDLPSQKDLNKERNTKANRK